MVTITPIAPWNLADTSITSLVEQGLIWSTTLYNRFQIELQYVAPQTAHLAIFDHHDDDKMLMYRVLKQKDRTNGHELVPFDENINNWKKMAIQFISGHKSQSRRAESRRV